MSEKDKSKTDQEVGCSLISNFIFIYIVVIAIILFLKTIGGFEYWIVKIESYIAPGVTLFIFLYTTSETRKIQEENRKESRRIQDESRKNSIKPILDLSFPQSFCLGVKESLDSAIIGDSCIYKTPIDNDSSPSEEDKKILKLINYTKDNTARIIGLKITLHGEEYESNYRYISGNEYEYVKPKVDFQTNIDNIFGSILPSYISDFRENDKSPYTLLEMGADLTYYDTETTYYTKKYTIVFQCESMRFIGTHFPRSEFSMFSHIIDDCEFDASKLEFLIKPIVSLLEVHQMDINDSKFINLGIKK
ncbi:hypothetical protein [Metaclostridioides mangenotii]|uniref:hypothetical protein n=1 Tax=Metaclostridioides mangenotii TaxID=1540 RepID=UPI0026F16700|nr:hypothetical protein [Clostridioides mangenotii]